jgi:hypothetical protein
MEELPQIYTSPRRRTGSFVGSSSYTRRHKRRRGPSLGALLFYWLTSAAAGIALGYSILFYGLGKDPAKVGAKLPQVNVEWPQQASPQHQPPASATSPPSGRRR